MSSRSLVVDLGHQSAVNDMLARGYEPEYLPEIDFYSYNVENSKEELPYIKGHYTPLKLKEKKILEEIAQIQNSIFRIEKELEKDGPSESGVSLGGLKELCQEKLQEIETLRSEYLKKTPVIDDKDIPFAQRLGKYLFEETLDNRIGDEEYQDCKTPDFERLQYAIRASETIAFYDLDKPYELKDNEYCQKPLSISAINLLKMAIIAGGDEPLEKRPNLDNILMSLAALTKSLPQKQWEVYDKEENPEYKSFENMTQIHKLNQASQTPLAILAMEVLEKSLLDNRLFRPFELKGYQVANVERAVAVGKFIRNIDITKEIMKENRGNYEGRRVEQVYKQLNETQKEEYLKRIAECCKLVKEDARLRRSWTDPIWSKRNMTKEVIDFAKYNDPQGDVIRNAALRKMIFGDSGSPMFEKVYKDGVKMAEPAPKPKEAPKKGILRGFRKWVASLNIDEI